MFRRRGARDPAGRGRRPAVRRAGGRRRDHPDPARPPGPGAQRAAGRVPGVYRAQGGDQPPAGPGRPAGQLGPLPGAGLPGRRQCLRDAVPPRARHGWPVHPDRGLQARRVLRPGRGRRDQDGRRPQRRQPGAGHPARLRRALRAAPPGPGGIARIRVLSLATGEPRRAAGYAEAAVAADPLDETAHRWRMSAAAASGEPARAIAVYEALRQRLGAELGTDPAPPTRELHLAILRERGNGTWLIVEPYAADDTAGNLNPVGRVYYGASTLLCVPNALSQPGGYALGALPRRRSTSSTKSVPSHSRCAPSGWVGFRLVPTRRGPAELRCRRDSLADRPARGAGLGGDQAEGLAGSGRGGPGSDYPGRG